ncbi:hypothetical protein MHC_04880 [Mycoplasma haemocanis str. Illinois]|uniref:Uncharacterized protein n=1 Tax=Mycoplasma haemocanis (strain Illinois) TaxID=1111676 RepID=H6N860_MYCHN|nr:hypothetical protein [Mycoplasma haemocanis]AEW45832.1 hypothetical protein MHC_04880 [Mycoplasma haemocanis str. Illinois]
MNLIKPLIVFAGSGTIVATGAYLTRDSWISSKKTKTPFKRVSQALLDNNYKPLDTTRADSWKSILSKYNAAYSVTKTTVDLQNECRVLLEKEEFNDGDYQKARRWCVETQSVQNRLGFFNRASLSTSSDTDDSKWKEKITSHKGVHSNKLNHNFGDEEAKNVTDIKSECGKLSSKESVDEDFESSFSKFYEWCSVNSQ